MSRTRSPFRPSLESLESRDTPAGSLVASLINGQLTLTGTDNAEVIQLQPQSTPGSFRILGQSGTTIGGMTEQTFTNVSNIRFVLRGGNDTVSLNTSMNPAFVLSGTLDFQGGDGDNSLTFGSLFSPTTELVQIGRDLLISNGSGEDRISLDVGGGTSVAGRVLISNGNGDSSVTGSRLSVNGALGLSVLAGEGEDSIRLGRLNVVRNASFNLGNGEASVTISGGTLLSPGGTSRIGGALSVIVGAGDGSFSVNDTFIVDGAVSLNLGDLGSLSLGSGPTTLNSLVSTAGTLFVSGSGSLTIDRDAAFAGINSTIVDLSGRTTILGNLSYRGGSGGIGNRFEVDSFSTTPLTIGGNATFVFGTRSFNELTIAAGGMVPSSIGGNLAIVGGNGTDEITLDNLRVARNTSVNLGNGNNRLAFGQGIGAVQLRGALSVVGGAGIDNLQFLNASISGATAISVGDGADNVTIADTVFAQFTLNTGAGDDRFNVEPTFFGTGPGTMFRGVVNVILGAGNDSMQLGRRGSSPRVVMFATGGVINGDFGINTFASNDANFTGTVMVRTFANPSS